MAEPHVYDWMKNVVDEILRKQPTHRSQMLAIIAAAFAEHDVERVLRELADEAMSLIMVRHRGGGDSDGPWRLAGKRIPCGACCGHTLVEAALEANRRLATSRGAPLPHWDTPETLLTGRSERLAAENAALRAQLAEMRGVLEKLEYAAADGMCRVCPMCKGVHASMAHIHTCPLGRALGRPECAADTTGEEREGR